MSAAKPQHDYRFQQLRPKVLLRDNYICQWCGAQLRRPGSDIGKPPHVDHVVPVTRGGARFDMGNLVASCSQCNLRKGNRMLVRRRSRRRRDTRRGGLVFEPPRSAPPHSEDFSPRAGKRPKRQSRSW